MQQKILFLIPVYKHNPEILVSEIRDKFPLSEILIIDDGEGLDGKKLKNVEIIRHKFNLGLAQSLIEGYEKTLQKDADIIVKIDADREYPVYPVRKIIEILNAERGTSGAYVELKRSIFTNGVIDSLFHIIFGAIEGQLLFKRKMCQHSPGLHVYKRQSLERILPKAKEVHQFTKKKWGLDLVFLHLANHEGKLVPYTIFNHSWRERRSRVKILRQIYAASILLIFLKYYSIVKSIKINGALDDGIYKPTCHQN